MAIRNIRSLRLKSVFSVGMVACVLSGLLTSYAQAAQESENSMGIDWNQDGLKIVFVIAVIYVLVRIFLRKRRSEVNRSQVPPQDLSDSAEKTGSLQDSSNASSYRSDDAFGGIRQNSTGQQPSSREQRAQAAWGVLMDQNNASPQNAGHNSGDLTTQEASNSIPAVSGTVEEEFLRGAKLLYARIYDDMDNNDVDDIRNFVTDNGLSQIQSIIARREIPGTTDLLLVNAEVCQLDTNQAAVQFITLMRRPGQANPEEVRETWRFTRSDPSHTWMVDSVEQ